MATFPSYHGALMLWSFYGVSTILLFWAALIKATREWGGIAHQGRAYGLLDGGRGVLAAVLASLGVLLFSVSFPGGYEQASLAQREAVLRTIILGYTLVTALAGVFVWFALRPRSPFIPSQPNVQPQAQSPDRLPSSTSTRSVVSDSERVTVSATNHLSAVASKESTAGWRQRYAVVMRRPTVWLQAVIVLCAYVGYKGFDNYSLFAVQAYGLSEEKAAGIVALGAWVRPIAAIGAGLFGDRIRPSRALAVLFALLLVSYLFFAIGEPRAATSWVLIGNTLLTCVAIFGLRGLYFAVFEEAKLNATVTGTAIGIVSVFGYTPDIFVALVAGILIDRSPGLPGHQHFFWFLAAFALMGLIASMGLARSTSAKAF